MEKIEKGLLTKIMRGCGLLLLAVLLLAAPATAALVDNNDGTVTDNVSGLQWQKCSLGQTWNSGTGGCDGTAQSYTWQQALAVCQNLGSDWRLPNIFELRSIVDYSRYNPAIDPAVFPSTVSSHYWSSTTFADNTSSAWRVGFYDGSGHGGGKSSSYYSSFGLDIS